MDAKHFAQDFTATSVADGVDEAFVTALIDSAAMPMEPNAPAVPAVEPASERVASSAEQDVSTGQAEVPADQFNFKRYELKYLISPEQRAELDRLIAENLVPDEHGRSLVTSIYYDTPSDLLMRRSIEGGVYKEKLRVRLYGPLAASSQVFVEIKKKCDGVVYKRRVAATPAQADFAIATGKGLGDDQISREIEGFVARYPGIEAAMVVSCERCAYHTASETGEVLGGGADAATELRLTLDENIRWLDREDGRVWFDRQGEGHELIPEGYVLMEAKCGGALPLWFVDFLSRNQIRSRSFSKCGTAYRTRQAERAARVAAQGKRAVQPNALPQARQTVRPQAFPAPNVPLARHVAKPRTYVPDLNRA